MAEKTSFFGLTKPSQDDFYDIDVQNQNLELIETAIVARMPKIFNVNLPNTAWTEDAVNGGYVCAITVSGILATDNPIVDIVLGADRDANALYIEAWALVTRIVTGENTVTLYANESVPETAFTIQVKVVR